MRGLVTKPTSVCWNPRTIEQELRERIMELQNVVLLGESEVQSIYKLAQLTHNLKVNKTKSKLQHSIQQHFSAIKIYSAISKIDSETSVVGEEERGLRENKSQN